MPELPDLEVYKGNIFNKLTSKRLVGVKVFSQKIATPESILAEELAGNTLATINRFGKELLFDFSDKKILTAHLMLNGKITITPNPADAEKIMSKVLMLNFENESLVIHDTGNIGAVVRYKPRFDNTPDAFGDNFTLEYFISMAQKKAVMNVKAFLIDQKIIKGIGNAYADEILYVAGISPKSIIGKIPENILAQLYKAIGSVLQDAIVSIKAIAPDIISGEERSFLKVHVKYKKKTDTGFPISIETIASKITYFTEEQILYK